jgi:hypothetical protein
VTCCTEINHKHYYKHHVTHVCTSNYSKNGDGANFQVLSGKFKVLDICTRENYTVPDRGEWSASGSGRFTPRKEPTLPIGQDSVNCRFDSALIIKFRISGVLKLTRKQHWDILRVAFHSRLM